MSETENNGTSGNQQQSSSEAWEDVGRQFQSLGESLAATLRTTWQNERNQQRVSDMRDGLEAMVVEVNQAIHDSVSSQDTENVKEEAKKAFKHLHDTGEQTVTELRPHLLSALQQVNTEIEKLINRMQNEESE